MITDRQTITLPDGQDMDTFTLENANGYMMKVMSLGATVTELWMPDKDGKRQNILLSPPSLNDYRRHRPYYGSVVGPVAGRIAEGRYMWEGKEVTLEKNEGSHHLHGGSKGFDTQVWESDIETNGTETTIQFMLPYKGKAGQIPGKYQMLVRYTLTDQNEWKIQYNTTSADSCLLNPTNHAYFNLSGNQTSILEHTLQIQSDDILLLDEEMIPRGEKLRVEGTAFDFREQKVLSDTLLSQEPQILSAKGLDHPFLLRSSSEEPLIHLCDPGSGRSMHVCTDREAVVVYTHNHEMEELGVSPWSGIALETQMVPNAIHLKEYQDSVTLDASVPFVSETVYQFSVESDKK